MFTLFLLALVTILLAVTIVLAIQFLELRKQNDNLSRERGQLEQQFAKASQEVAQFTGMVAKLRAEVQRLARFQNVADVEALANKLKRESETVLADAKNRASEIVGLAQQESAQLKGQSRTIIDSATQQASELVAHAHNEVTATLHNAKLEAQSLKAKAKEEADAANDKSRVLLDAATRKAREIRDDAEKKAREIAGSAYEAMQNASQYERIVRAMKNVIEGYGDRYLVPSHSLLDDLAEEFGHTRAGEELKIARDRTRLMIENGTAAACDYVEAGRKATAISFVIDAFNGKVDSILSRVRHDNAGTLQQEIRDAFELVNANGKAFREARITEEFLAARLNELQWAAVAHQLRLEEREEQRRIKEQIREEAKARREYERAIRETAKEEDVIRRAMQKAQEQIDQATAEQKSKYEQQLAELNQKLKEAEERNQRALSMAQQTRRGHVYVISNIGSFGESVYKIGMTRRLEPLDRIRELGDSSVPFEFDVHAMITSDDAPTLEKQLHRHFVLAQVNKVNHRKEFFRATVAEIRAELESLGLATKWTMAAEAAEYRETLAIEKAIAEKPDLREAWINRQLQLDLTDNMIEDESEEEVNA